MKLKSILRYLLPMYLRRIRGIYLCHKKALATDEYLQKIAEELRPELMRNLVILPHRLNLIAKMPQGAVIAEIGVEYGNLSEKIFNINIPRKLHLIDLWPSQSDANMTQMEVRFMQQIENKVVSLHQGLSWDMLERFPNNTFDWVYIDAGHDYDSAAKDLEVCKRKVKNNGYICGHDYVRWSGKGLYRFGVIEAVNAFCNANNYEMVYMSNEKDRHQSFAIKLIT